MKPVQLLEVDKSFGSHRVFHALSLSLHPDEVTFLVGANGSGKSTLLRLAAGLSRPDRGTIKADLHVAVGYCGHRTGLYPQFTVEENLSFVAALRGCPRELPDLVEEWELRKVRGRPLAALSKGLQSRVALCAATLGAPGYLFLDEPSAALDDHGVDLLRSHLLRRRDGKEGFGVVVIATHDLGRMLDFATRVLVINEGEVLADSASSDAMAISIATVIERYHSVNR